MATFSVSTVTRSRLATLASFSAEDWRVLLTAWCLLPLIAMSLRILDYPRTRDVMRRFVQETGRVAAPEVQIERVTRLVGVAARHGACRASCLCLALAVWWLLARRGVETRLKIGVRKDPTGFSAHAWVERDGVVLTGGADAHERYQPMT
jgi:hypothetical protein